MSTGTSCHFGHLLQVLKKIISTLILNNFLHDCIDVYSPNAGADSPRVQSFDVNRNVLSPYSFVASFKNMSLESDFIHFFMI